MKISSYLFLFGVITLSLNSIHLSFFGISDWAFLFSILFAFVETALVERKNFGCWFKNPLILPASIIGVSGVFTLFRSANISANINELFQIVYIFTLFISLTWIMIRRKMIKEIIFAFIVSGLIALIIVFLDYFTDLRLGSIISGKTEVIRDVRFAGPFQHPNTLGSFLVEISLLSIAFWLSSKANSTRRKLSLLLFLASIFGIFLSGSNSANLGLIISLCFIFLITTKNIRNRITILIMSCLIILVIFSATSILFEEDIEFLRIFSRHIGRVINTTFATRVDIYKLAIKEFFQHPLVGIGFDQLPTSGITDSARLLPGMVHNVFISFLYCGGLLPFLTWLFLFIYILYVSIKIGLSSKNGHGLILVGIASSCFSILLVFMQFTASIYRRDWWLLFGLMLACFWDRGREAKVCTDSYSNE